MTKYTLINFEKDKFPEKEVFPRTEEDITFKINDGKDINIFICDQCFKTFNARNLHHLENCRMEWPFQDCKICKIIPSLKIRIYSINKEREIISKKVMGAIYNLARLSKEEQGLGLPISGKGLLGRIYQKFPRISMYYCYILFSYKRIVAYCLVQEYYNLFFDTNSIIIRDIFTFQPFRKKGYAKLLLSEISRQHQKLLSDLIFSFPTSFGLKCTLKSLELKKHFVISNEDFSSCREEEL